MQYDVRLEQRTRGRRDRRGDNNRSRGREDSRRASER